MKKIFYVIVAIFLLPFSLLARGGGEKEWLVPSNAMLVAGFDTARLRESSLGNKLLYGIPGNEESVDGELEARFGILSEDLGRIVFFLEDEAEGGQPPAGVSLELKEKDPAAVLASLKERYPGREQNYREQYTYTQLELPEMTLFAFPLAKRLLLSPEMTGMEAMLSVLAGEDDLERNNELFKLAEAHKGGMFYAVGVVPPEILRGAPEIFSQILRYSLDLTLDEGITLLLDLQCENPENATNIANFMKLSLAMSAQMVPEGNPQLKEMLQRMLAPVQIEAQGKSVKGELVYDAELIQDMLTFLPLLSGGTGTPLLLDSFSL